MPSRAPPPPPRIRKQRKNDIIVLRQRRFVNRRAADPIAAAPAPLARISKVRPHVVHSGTCQLNEFNACVSTALHELACGHLFCSECIVAHLKVLKASKKRGPGDYRLGRRKIVSEANLNMKTRKVTCFLCRKAVQCGCSKRVASDDEILVGARLAADGGCFTRPAGGMCVHKRQKSNCKQCSKTCPHGKIKHFCKPCGGCMYCKHGKAKSLCRLCKALKKGGGSICEHDRARTTCKDCGGGSLCVHGKNKRKCRACGGKNLCTHGREKYSCKDCKGKAICEHGTLRRTCKTCKGAGYCTHGKLKAQCRDCGGSVFCHHNKRWRVCRCAHLFALA